MHHLLLSHLKNNNKKYDHKLAPLGNDTIGHEKDVKWQLTWGSRLYHFFFFWTRRCPIICKQRKTEAGWVASQKYLKDNIHNSLHLAWKCALIFSSLDALFSSKLIVFLELCSQRTVFTLEQRSWDKYLWITSHKMKAIVLYIHQLPTSTYSHCRRWTTYSH